MLHPLEDVTYPPPIFRPPHQVERRSPQSAPSPPWRFAAYLQAAGAVTTPLSVASVWAGEVAVPVEVTTSTDGDTNPPSTI